MTKYTKAIALSPIIASSTATILYTIWERFVFRLVNPSVFKTFPVMYIVFAIGCYILFFTITWPTIYVFRKRELKKQLHYLIGGITTGVIVGIAIPLVQSILGMHSLPMAGNVIIVSFLQIIMFYSFWHIAIRNTEGEYEVEGWTCTACESVNHLGITRCSCGEERVT